MKAEQIAKLVEETNAAFKEAMPEDVDAILKFYKQTIEALKRKAATNEKFRSIIQP